LLALSLGRQTVAIFLPMLVGLASQGGYDGIERRKFKRLLISPAGNSR